MKRTINFYEFEREFNEVRPESFSYEGLNVLYDYLEQLEDDLGQEIELDPIGLCCDFSEMTLDDVISEYSVDIEEGMDEEDIKDAVRDELEKQGVLVGETPSGFVIYNV